jgi:hypothetical protein
VIVKSLSIKNKDGIRRLAAYIFKEAVEPAPRRRQRAPQYPSGARLSKKDMQYLLEEIEDRAMLKEFKDFQKAHGTGDHGQFVEWYADKHKAPFVIRRNLLGNNLGQYCDQFEENEERRARQASNRNYVDHVIISWAPEDGPHLSDKSLYEFGNEFCRLRGDKVLILGTKHSLDGANVHLHLMVSSTELGGKAARLSRASFQEIKEQLQAFQKERYPELVSLPEHGKKRREMEKGEREQYREYKKNERADSRSTVLEVLDSAYGQATGISDFIAQIERKEVQPYYRNGVLTGVVFEGIKWRFSRLEYSEKLNSLQQAETKEKKQLEDLKELRAGKKRNLDLLRGSISKGSESKDMDIVKEDGVEGVPETAAPERDLDDDLPSSEDAAGEDDSGDDDEEESEYASFDLESDDEEEEPEEDDDDPDDDGEGDDN